MNFDYMKQFTQLAKLYEYCEEADEFALAKPNISATAARKAVEYIVKLIYSSIAGYDCGVTVFEMMTDVRFTEYVGDETLMSSFHYIRKMGNVAVHDGELTADDSLHVLEHLHFLVGETVILLGLAEDYPEFVKPTEKLHTDAQLAAAEKANTEKNVGPSETVAAYFAPRMRQVRFNTNFKRDESENRRLFLLASLREAGWPVVNVPDQAMPASAGINMLIDEGEAVDYILYGRDSRPLAVVEYTTTCENIVEGRKKGIRQAKKLAVKYGYKPVVYYTNGYNIFIIDQLGYKPRRVFQFHSLEELELLKLRSGMRQDISAPSIDKSIAGREYQEKAIGAVCNAFSQYRRRSLLVMATGTGKTRVSIALVDVLMKANWVKNVLFLADRTSLVRQAHKNFSKLLPNVTTSVYSGGSMSRDANARVIFSTYQTMINLINDDTREFGIGRFDLIIIDEAHRSIFKKYSALFRYFDALMVGLTATPRAEDNKSTYQMFELRNGCPDYAYELEEAISDGFLVGFSVLDKTTDALRRGIHYDELSDDDKLAFEDTFANSEKDLTDRSKWHGAVIESGMFKNARYINLGTIDAMLNDLMKNGLKVNGGDKLGKTIIFASSHLEAEKIVERFQLLYSYLGLDFCKLIDSQIPDSLALIDSFGERDSMPQVAVSVDMMDTGIDVPDVLNLVFFKGVRSKIKFLQMIGRGTRLSPDIFGPSLDKKGFLIFDYHDNCNFFRTRNTWSMLSGTGNKNAWDMPSQSALINQRKLSILRNLIEKSNRTAFEDRYMDELRNYFISSVQALCNDDIQVQYNMAYVSKYRTSERWYGFTNEKMREIKEKILPLIPPESAPAKVKTFDLLIYSIEAEAPQRMEANKDIRKIRLGFANVGKQIDNMIYELLKLKTIPDVMKNEELISQMHMANLLFDNFSLEQCEKVRKQLRDLMQYIPDDVRYYVINVKDFVIDGGSDSEVASRKTYSEKAAEFISSGNPSLAKIRNLDALTQEEKNELDEIFKERLGTVAEYAAWSGNRPLLPLLRVQVGIADDAVQTKFGSFLNDRTLNPQQLAYMNQIISYTRENGDITFLDLQRVSPFCDSDIVELFGTQINLIKELINGLHKPVM